MQSGDEELCMSYGLEMLALQVCKPSISAEDFRKGSKVEALWQGQYWKATVQKMGIVKLTSGQKKLKKVDVRCLNMFNV